VPLLLKHADDGERNLLNPDDLSSRILIVEESLGDPIPQEGDLRGAVHVFCG